MFSYSFAVKLTDRNISLDSPEALFESENRTLKVERKEDNVLLISSEWLLKQGGCGPATGYNADENENYAPQAQHTPP